MLTNPQKSLLKRAQRAAQIPDEDYRHSLATVTGWPDCRSSTDSRLTDEHVDKLLKWWEYGYWSAVDAGALAHIPHRHNPFRDRDYWSRKNTPVQNSRDLWSEASRQRRITAAETALQRLGKSHAYLAAIRRRTGGGWNYIAALERTHNALTKNKKAHAQPH